MIPNFPQPYPDELLYSVVARCHWLSYFPNDRALRRMVFGRPDVRPAIDFPMGLDALQSAYGPESPWDTFKIIQALTLVPFYAPFISLNRLDQIEKAMRGRSEWTAARRAANPGKGVPRHSHLRYCPECCEEERRVRGEAYWHRLPQLPGIYVCPVHQVFFESSTIQVANGSQRGAFMAAEDCITFKDSRKLSLSDPVHMALLRIAKSAAWLEKGLIRGNDGQSLRNRYLNRAMELGYASGSGCISWMKLIPDFRRAYSPELLNLLHSALPTAAPKCRDHWISLILHQSGKLQTPVPHLLLMDFFGLSAEEFFQIKREQTPFGSGPWNCRNLVCPEFGKPVIVSVVIEQSEFHGCPVGILECPACGQVRCQANLDSGPHNWVRAYGPLFEKALKPLWMDPTETQVSIGVKLGVTSSTVKRYARGAGLPERLSTGELSATPTSPLLKKRDQRIKAQRILSREKWLKLRRKAPSSSTSELFNRVQGVYAFLYRHDREWLKANSPVSRRRPPPRRTPTDWNSRDRLLVVEVTQALKTLYSTSGPPQKVTITAVGTAIGKLSLLYQGISRLPLTRAALGSGVESSTNFAIRKIVWEVDSMKKDGVAVNRQKLIRRANLSQENLRNMAVTSAIEVGLARLQPQNQSHPVELAA